MATTIQGTCGKCNGTGTLTWTANADGLCFACKGTGKATGNVPDRADRLQAIARNIEEAATSTGYDLDCAVEAIAQNCAAILDPRVTARALAALNRNGLADAAREVARMVRNWTPAAI